MSHQLPAPTNTALGDAPHALTSVTTAPPALAFDTTILAGQVSTRSLAMYARDFAPYCAFAGAPEVALAPETLARWRTALVNDPKKYSPHTINRMLAAVKSVMRAAAEQGYLEGATADAFARVRGVKLLALRDRLKPHRRTRVTPEAMRQLCDAPDTTTLQGLRDTALLHTLASSGLRVAEVARLTPAQILADTHGYALRIRGKNDLEERAAPLSAEAHAAIRRWLAVRPVESASVFTSFSGGNKDYSHRSDPHQHRLTNRPLSSAAIWLIVRHYADLCGLSHVKPHDFRRFVGTQLAAGDIRKAQKALGHKRIDTTAQHYVLDELERGLTDHLY